MKGHTAKCLELFLSLVDLPVLLFCLSVFFMFSLLNCPTSAIRTRIVCKDSFVIDFNLRKTHTYFNYL